MKKLLTLLILSSVIFGLLPTISLAASPSELEQQIEDVRREREVLLEEQRKLQVELEVTNRESQTLGTAVKSLDATRKKLAKDISITQSRITSSNLTIRSLESTMSKKEQQIVIHRRAIADTLVALSEYDSRSLVLSLLASVQLSDIWKDRSQLEGLNSRLEEEINTLRQTRKALNQEKDQKVRVKEAQISLQGQLSGQKSVVEENQKAKKKLLVETKNKEAEYQKMLAENIARQKEFEEDLFRLESELKITLDPSLIPKPRKGILSWPFDSAYMEFCNNTRNKKSLGNSTCITQFFGKTSFSNFHKGLDFRAAVGTPVRTMLSGVIQGVGNSDEQRGCYSYGRWVLVKYPNGLSSIYAHLSASIVKTGQVVKTGDILGYSGGVPGVNGSGSSTGPHLHASLIASQGVEIRPFTSRRYLTTSSGCNKVLIPVADLKAYLDPLAYLPAL